MREQRRQIRIIQLVIDDKADIDRDGGSVVVDGNRVAVSAGPKFAVVDRHRITF
jgi:hypothetical protein